MRVVLFERFDEVIGFSWWLFVGSAALIFFWLDYRVALGIMVMGMLFRQLVSRVLQPMRVKLLRSGDSIEFVQSDHELSEQFAKGILIGPIKADEAVKRKLFDGEHSEIYRAFFMVSTGKKNRVIPYEWIMGIELNELPLP